MAGVQPSKFINYVSEFKKLLVTRNNGTITQKFKVDSNITDDYYFSIVNSRNQLVDLTGRSFKIYGSIIDAKDVMHILFYSDTADISDNGTEMHFKINTYTSQYMAQIKNDKIIDLTIIEVVEPENGQGEPIPEEDQITQVILRDQAIAYKRPYIENQVPAEILERVILTTNVPLTGCFGAGQEISLTDGSNGAAFGLGLDQTGNGQLVIGQYNEADNTKVFIIGDGTDPSNRSNLFTIDYLGNVEAKSITVDGADVATKDWVADQLTGIDFSDLATKTELASTSAAIVSLIPDTSNMATTSWVQSQGYITNSSLAPYALQNDLVLSTSNLNYQISQLALDIPTKTSDLTNDSGYITGYTAGTGISISNTNVISIDGELGKTYYADDTTLQLNSSNNTFSVKSIRTKLNNGPGISLSEDSNGIVTITNTGGSGGGGGYVYTAGQGLALSTITEDEEYQFYVDEAWLGQQIEAVTSGIQNLSAGTGLQIVDNIISVSAQYLSAVPEGYATESWVEQNFLSTIPDTFATKDYVTGQVSGKADLSAISEMATTGWVVDQHYITSAEAPSTVYFAGEGLALEESTFSLTAALSDITGYSEIVNAIGAKADSTDLQNYVLTSSMSAYATSAWVDENYALKTDIPSSVYTKDEVDAISTALSSAVSGAGYLTEADINDLAKQADLETVSGIATNNATDISTLSGNLATVSGQTSTNATDIETLSTAVQTATGDITSLITNIETVSGIATGNATDIGTLSTNLGTVTSNVETISGNLTTVSGKVDTNEGNISTLSTDLGTANDNISTISSNLTTVSGKVDTNASNIETLSTTVETATGDITGLRTDVDTVSGIAISNQTDIGTLSTDLGTANGNISTLSTNLGTISGDLDTAESNISTLSTDLGTANTKISTLSGQLNTASTALKGNVDYLSGQIDAVSGNTNTVSTNLITLSSEVNTVSTTLNNAITGNTQNISTLSTNLDTVSGRVNTNETNIGLVSSNLNTLSGELNTTSTFISGKVDTLSGELNTASSTLTSQTNYISSTVDTICTAFSGAIDDTNTNLETLSGELNTTSTFISGKVNTLSGELNTASSTLTSQTSYLSGQIDTTNNNVSTISGNLNTVSGNLITVSGNLNTVSANLNEVSGKVDYISADYVTSGVLTGYVNSHFVKISQLANDVGYITLGDIPGGGGGEPVYYTAGNGLALNGTQFSLTGTVLSGDGTTVQIVDNIISAIGGGTTYTPGTGIDIQNGVISVSASWLTDQITGTVTSSYISGLGFAQTSAIPTVVSDLTNDAGYIDSTSASTIATNAISAASGNIVNAATGWVSGQNYLSSITVNYYDSEEYLSTCYTPSIQFSERFYVEDWGNEVYVDWKGFTITDRNDVFKVIQEFIFDPNDFLYDDENGNGLTWLGFTVDNLSGDYSSNRAKSIVLSNDFIISYDQNDENKCTISLNSDILTSYAQLSDIPSVVGLISASEASAIASAVTTGYLTDYATTGYVTGYCSSFITGYTAGTGIDIQDGVISCTVQGGSDLSTVYDMLSAGPNINLSKDDQTGITTISAAAGGGGTIDADTLCGMLSSANTNTLIISKSGNYVVLSAAVQGGGGGGSYTAGTGIDIQNGVISCVLTGVSDLNNDSQFITADDITNKQRVNTVNGDTITYNPSYEVFKTTYTGGSVTLNAVTATTSQIANGEVATFEQWITFSTAVTAISEGTNTLIGEWPAQIDYTKTHVLVRRLANNNGTITQYVSYAYSF